MSAPGYRRADMSLTLDVDEAVATVCFAHPPVNALSGSVIDELEQVVDRLAQDDSVRVVVFTGSGTKAFLSGADITELPALMGEPGALQQRAARVNALCDRIAGLPQPTIAAVQASAIGGGLEFALLCDLFVCAQDAVLALPEVGLGLLPGAGGTQRLPRRLPLTVAMGMLLLGEPLSAQDALSHGLVNRVLPAAEVLPEALRMAHRLARAPLIAVRALKRAVYLGLDAPLADGLHREAESFAEAARSQDAAEGVGAFLERRRPVFSHR